MTGYVSLKNRADSSFLENDNLAEKNVKLEDFDFIFWAAHSFIFLLFRLNIHTKLSTKKMDNFPFVSLNNSKIFYF